LEEDFDEDSTAGRGFFFVEVDDREDVPTNGIGGQ
jgi:hypothetical protein